MTQKKPNLHGLPQQVKLTPEQEKEIMEHRRQQEALGQRAKITGNILTTIIRTYPDLPEEEQLGKATRLAEMFMDKLLGVRFEVDKEGEK